MGLAEFALVSRKWKPATLIYKPATEYTHLLEYIPADLLEARLSTIKQTVHTSYPRVWIDTYLFFLAIFFVLFAAAFSIGLQSTYAQHDKLWYPLLILIAPAFIAFWTSRRRGLYYKKLKEFNDLLQKCLKDINSMDASRQIKWHHRRLREDDTAEILGLSEPLSRWQVMLVIEVIQIDPEDIQVESQEMILPSYNAAVQDIVQDVGPIDWQNRHPNEEHNVTDLQQQTMSTPLSYSHPPEYHQNQPTQSHPIELTFLSPPPPSYHHH